MIISTRPTAHSASPDPVANSVRTFIAPSARLTALRTETSLPSVGRRDDFARLYPSLFAAGNRTPSRSRTARAAAAALTAAGTIAAAFMAVLQK